MPAKASLYVAGAFVIAALLIDSLTRGHSPETAAESAAPIGPGVTAAFIALWIFDRWAWRQAGINKIVGRPVPARHLVLAKSRRRG